MGPQPRRISFLLLTALLAVIPHVPAFAQATGGIRGTVLDKDGQPVAGATLVVENKSLGVQTGAPSDAKGEFRIAPLPPGKGYSITASSPGMAKIILSDIEVTAHNMLVVPIVLRSGKDVQEIITITGKGDVVNPETATTSTRIPSEVIDELPILGRDYQEILTLAPGVTDVDGDGNPNIHGARDTDVNTLVDGVSTVDPLTGKVGQQLGINTIQDIEVITSAATAEYDRAQGGFVRVSTKSGGNDFEGSFRLDWRGNALDGDGAGIDPAKLHGGLGENGLRDLTFNDIYPALTLSGPIVKDRAWYFISAEYRQVETPVNALTQAFVRGHYEQRLFGKFTWEMSTNHKLVFTVTFDPQKDDNQGLNSFTAIDAGYTAYGGGRNVSLRETAVFSPSVFLETQVADFDEHPYTVGTTGPDTNKNGILFIDRNHDGFIDATERDAGEDYDRDGVFDVYEDFIKKNGMLDPGEDRDGDHQLTPPNGCEGVHREDVDCDGHIDYQNEDDNHNGILDPGEDRDGDGRLDLGTEDRNHNQRLDDTPFPANNNGLVPDESGNLNNYYPYHEAAPTPRDRDYETDQRTLRTTGPYFLDFNGTRGRQTLRQDLTIYVPEWHGQHEMKTGYVVEREHYDQTTNLRPQVLPNASPQGASAFEPKVGVILPAENQVENSAKSLTAALYVTDTYKPLPNLTLNLGLRFTRETTDSFGYTPFDPVAERNLYDRLNALTGEELTTNVDDSVAGNNDGLINAGICGDQLLYGDNSCKTASNAVGNAILDGMLKPKVSRLTQHHTATTIVANDVATLYPEAVKIDPVTGETSIDREKMRDLGAVFQEQEPFRLTNNNLAPRLAISWDPWSDSKTKIFASWGRFYDKLFLNAVTTEEGPDTISRYYKKDADGVTAAGVPDAGIGNAISKAPPSTNQIDRGLQTPFTDEWSVGFERELAPEVSLRMSFISRNGRQGLQDRDINHTLRYDPNTGRPLDNYGRVVQGEGGHDDATLTPAGDVLPDLFIENFFFNSVLRLGNYNTSVYHGIELEISKRLSRKWQMDTSYTYSRARGDAEDFQSFLGNDPAAVPYEYGYLTYDERHVVRFNGSCFLPGDWTLGTVMEWHSGLPYSVITQRFSLDNFQYPVTRILFGQGVQTQNGPIFVPEDRNSRRNASVININAQATKAFVMGGMNSKLFLAIENLLNTDDLTINYYQPDNANRSGNLQLQAERRFGRRFSIGFQFEF